MSIPAEQQIVFAALYAVEFRHRLAEADRLEEEAARQVASLSPVGSEAAVSQLLTPWQMPSAPTASKTEWAALVALTSARAQLLATVSAAAAATTLSGSVSFGANYNELVGV